MDTLSKDITVGETSEAIGVRTQRYTRRAGALMANTDGLFGASPGKNHKTCHGQTVWSDRGLTTRSDHTVEMPQSILKNPAVAPGLN